ncbi:RAB6-interacting golgin [Dillenia turbinata]|uniref:RAB6-interacting golgin n=1 Tax=Dillenia turbinata TaxID=194707 RepID=A0AAN8WB60_9MAGN
MMQTQRQGYEQQQSMIQSVPNSGSLSFNGSLSKEDEEMSKSALTSFKAKEEEIEKKKLEVREKVQLQLGRVEEETKRLALIREEREYREALDAFNEKNKEKLVSESEKLRMKKLEELSKSIDSIH